MKPSQKTALLGMMAALAITLSFLESLLPALPFLPPGAKAGFSNIAVMFCLQTLGGPSALCVALLKSGFVLLTRGMTAFAMSFGGGMLATAISWICFRLNASLLLTGICSAVAHNTAQLLVAMALTATPQLFWYYPPLIIFALVAGSMTGLILTVSHPALCRISELMISPLKKRGNNHE